MKMLDKGEVINLLSPADESDAMILPRPAKRSRSVGPERISPCVIDLSAEPSPGAKRRTEGSSEPTVIFETPYVNSKGQSIPRPARSLWGESNPAVGSSSLRPDDCLQWGATAARQGRPSAARHHPYLRSNGVPLPPSSAPHSFGRSTSHTSSDRQLPAAAAAAAAAAVRNERLQLDSVVGVLDDGERAHTDRGALTAVHATDAVQRSMSGQTVYRSGQGPASRLDTRTPLPATTRGPHPRHIPPAMRPQQPTNADSATPGRPAARHGFRTPDEVLAYRLQAEEDAALARRAAQSEEARFQARLSELEAMEENMMRLSDSRWESLYMDVGLSRPSRDRSQAHRPRGHRWEMQANLGALMEPSGTTPPPGRRAFSMYSVAAMREAMRGLSQSGLPPHLLFSDRDFTADDYEWLCRLDENVENRQGASQDVINSLETETFVTAEEADEQQKCAVCLEEYTEGAELRVLGCKHRFHKECIDKWLQQKASCPVCLHSCKA